MAAETQPSLADAEAYVLDFVRARRERYSAAHILSEFHIPADAWPSDPEALTLAALASLVLCWVRGNADARADGPALRAVATHPTCWQPAAATAVMVAELGEGRDGVVVLDGLVDGAQRSELLELLVGSPPPAATVAAAAPPAERFWERTTCDGPARPRSWGLQPARLRAMAAEPCAAAVEVQSRLCALYPEYELAHVDGGDTGVDAATPLVANAPVHGDSFTWHVDADPAVHQPWAPAEGRYANGSAGRPLLVSLLVYLDGEWRPEWDAETLFVDAASGVGLHVQPRPGRAVLMHQDVVHRVSPPSATARRPRYSLVWKLAFVPRATRGAAPERETICRAEWGAPARLGRATPIVG